MGRKAKYATLNVYQEFITAIRKDLKIPDDVYVEVKFASLKGSRNGDMVFYHNKYMKVRVSKFLPHNDTLRVLMHEFRHVWQYATGKMVDKSEIKGKRYIHKTIWDNVEYDNYSDKTSTHYFSYYNSPWEIDARIYGDKKFELFPGGKVQSRKLVGVVGSVKFYKTSA